MRSEIFWGIALIALVVVGYGLVPAPDAREPIDSFSQHSGGKKAFFLLAEGLLADVDRNAGSIVPDDESADTLVMLGPARYPDRAQWQTLHDWVSEGRALVFAAKWQDPAVSLEPFGIEIVPVDSGPFSLGTDTEEAIEAEESTETGESDVVTDLVKGDFDWRSFGEIRLSSPDATVELSDDGTAQVVWQPVGDGAVVVVASDYIFTNRSLTRDNHGLLAFRILETAAPAGPVYFDEAMNAAGAPRVVGILLEPPFRLVTLQLLIVAVLFGWMTSRRFGPLVSTESDARRSLVEHAEALGNFHFEVGSGTKLLTAYLEFFRRELGLRSHGGTETLGRVPRDSTDHAPLDTALRAAKNPSLPRNRVAELVQSLARWRKHATELPKRGGSTT